MGSLTYAYDKIGKISKIDSYLDFDSEFFELDLNDPNEVPTALAIKWVLNKDDESYETDATAEEFCEKY